MRSARNQTRVSIAERLGHLARIIRLAGPASDKVRAIESYAKLEAEARGKQEYRPDPAFLAEFFRHAEAAQLAPADYARQLAEAEAGRTAPPDHGAAGSTLPLKAKSALPSSGGADPGQGADKALSSPAHAVESTHAMAQQGAPQ